MGKSFSETAIFYELNDSGEALRPLKEARRISSVHSSSAILPVSLSGSAIPLKSVQTRIQETELFP
ncbi:MAG: hypothetical protein GW938_04280 [Leptospira sp.]|nr:hypothetical protein [Leptospira sp.]NCS92357.1 hypothetical protein [Leptospira sp.]